MSDTSKVKSTHTQRAAVIYIRQSSPTQVVNNRESTERQYELVQRAIDLGWRRDQITLVDDDLGVSDDGIAKRAGFAQLAADVGLLKVGIVVGLAVSRLARNNANWYRLLDLCGITDTSSPMPMASTTLPCTPTTWSSVLKSTMSEAQLQHAARARRELLDTVLVLVNMQFFGSSPKSVTATGAPRTTVIDVGDHSCPK